MQFFEISVLKNHTKCHFFHKLCHISKKQNVIVVKLSYIDLVLKFHDNRLKNGKALAFSDVKK